LPVYTVVSNAFVHPFFRGFFQILSINAIPQVIRFTKQAVEYIPKLFCIAARCSYNGGMEELAELVLKHLGLEISARQIEQFSIYRDLLLEWNRKTNLTAIRDDREIIIKHFFDSLTCLKAINQSAPFSLADVGTGAGFPGIPLKIVLPEISLTLVESARKKTDFCKLAVDTLHLTNTTVVHARAEEAGQNPDLRESFEYTVARAVAELAVLAEYLLPLVKVGGTALAMKGKMDQEEVNAAERAVSIMGGRFSAPVAINLPEGYGQRVIYPITKASPTPPDYPRRAGVPSRKPICG
jgi:16S rRNA (guanine527-N7)-methyltransferase